MAVLILVVYAAALIALPQAFGVEVAGVVISPSRALLAVLLLVVLLQSGASALQGIPAALPWAAFLGVTAVSVLMNPSGAATARWLSFLIEGAGVWFAVWSVCRSAVDRELLQDALLFLTAAVALVACALFVFGIQYDQFFRSVLGLPGDTYFRERFGRMRVEGPFAQPLLFAVWLLPISSLALTALRSGGGHRRTAYAVAWFAISAAVFLTGSRVALIGVLVLPAAYLFIRRMSFAALVAGILALIVMAAMLQVTFANLPRAQTSTSPPSAGPIPASASPVVPASPDNLALGASGEMRLDAYRGGVKAIAQRPLFGWGLLSGSSVLQKATGRPNSVDSSYLQVGIESGVLGLAAFLWLLYAVLRLAARNLSSERQQARFVGLLAFLGMGLFASFVAVTQTYAAFWLYAAVVTVRTASTDADEVARSVPKRPSWIRRPSRIVNAEPPPDST